MKFGAPNGGNLHVLAFCLDKDLIITEFDVIYKRMSYIVYE